MPHFFSLVHRYVNRSLTRAGRAYFARIAAPPTRRASESGRHAARIPALDATRGIAMALVCLSHFAWAGMQTLGPMHGIGWAITLTMIAAPTFMLVSGMMLGYVSAVSPGAYGGFAAKLFERGVFLLTVAHLLLLPSRIYLAPHWGGLRSFEMTDTIGVCIILGPLLVTRLGAPQRLLLSTALVGITWAVIVGTPDASNAAVRALQHALFGHRGLNWWYSSFPAVPWFSVYLFGTVVGERLLPPLAHARNHNARLLVGWAACLSAGALVVQLAITLAISVAHDHAALLGWAQQLGDPFRKFPPSPEYLLVFAAAGLSLAALISFLVAAGKGRWLSDRAEVIGRASLFIFIVQSYLYYLVEVRWLHPLPTTWPLAFGGSLVVVYGLAHMWLRFGGNRLLTFPGAGRVRSAVASFYDGTGHG